MHMLTDATTFGREFPGLEPSLLTLHGQFFFPFRRDFAINLGESKLASHDDANIDLFRRHFEQCTQFRRATFIKIGRPNCGRGSGRVGRDVDGASRSTSN